MIVASSPSPYPNWAGPLVQELSLKPVAGHALFWFEPSSRYFQTAPVGTNVTDAAWPHKTHRARKPTLQNNLIGDFKKEAEKGVEATKISATTVAWISG